MKNCYWTLILSIVCVLPAVAQEDYRPGYVVSHEGDTLKGAVLFRNGLAKHELCTVKNSGGVVTTYRPADVTAYGFSGGGFYEAIPDKGQFMEVLALGRLDLLAVVGNLFLRDSTNKIHALESLTKKSEKQGTTYVFEQKEYLGILRWQMANCSKVQSRINETPLKIKPLTRLVSQYNACVGDKKVIAPAASRQHRWHAGVIVMYGQGKVNRLNENTLISLGSGGSAVRLGELADVKEFSTIKAVSYGISINAGIPRVHEGVSFSIEGLLQRYELSSSHSYKDSETRTYHNTVSASFQSIKVPVYIQYEWMRRRRVQPLLFFGVIANFNSTGDTGTVAGDSQENPPGHFTTTRVYKDLLPVQKLTISIVGGAGARVVLSDRFSLELKARYERGGGPVVTRTLTNAGTSHQIFGVSFGVGYTL